MIALVTGGAASGKSAYAESLAKALPGPHAYVATMRHGDAETEARIARHREMRAGKGFVTVELAPAIDLSDLGGGEGAMLKQSCYVEQPTGLFESCGTARGTFTPTEIYAECQTALLEDLGNLVANGLQEKMEDVLAFDNVVIVANEVGCDGIQYDPFTMDYIETLGALACQLGARADVVVEVVAGIPNVVKGEVPEGC